MRGELKALGSLQVPRGSWSSKLLPSPNKNRPGLEGEEVGSLPYCGGRVIMKAALQSQQESGWAGMQSKFTQHLIFIFPSWLKWSRDGKCLGEGCAGSPAALSSLFRQLQLALGQVNIPPPILASVWLTHYINRVLGFLCLGFVLDVSPPALQPSANLRDA